nr:efflux transporter outer membrane subunit [Comamonas koreensis]
MGMRSFIPLSAAAIIVMAGCTPLQPDKASAPQPLPADWSVNFPNSSAQLSLEWWRSFENEELNNLVQQALAQSQDIAAAVAQVEQAQAYVRIAGASSLPAVSGTLNASREGRLGGHASVDGSVAGAGLAASYELDVWGRVQAIKISALASWQASRFDHDAVRWTVTAAVASAWVQAVALEQRLVIAQLNLESAQRLLTLVESRHRAGAATSLELAQQRGLLASQRREIEALRLQESQARSALAVLLGQTDALKINTLSLDLVRLPSIAAGQPSDLLVRRPDIARAEAQLAAANGDVQAARAAMLPSILLAGSIATSGATLGRVFDNPLYSLAAGLAAPIFDGGRLASERDLALARREELVANYRSAIMAAFNDVEVALSAGAGLDAQSAAQDDELHQARRALALAESRYRAGSDTLLTMLDAQRTLYAAQDQAVQLKAQRLQAAVALYKALGGGWAHASTSATEQ